MTVATSAASAHSRQLALDHAHEGLQRLGSRERRAIDEEGRRAIDAKPCALVDVLLHQRLVLPAGDALIELSPPKAGSLSTAVVTQELVNFGVMP